MLRQLPLLCLLPTLAYSAVQCYVGQKLFAYESNNAICASYVPYQCAVACEWKKNCEDHKAWSAFQGRRTFVSGLLMNTKSLMVLCCTSLSTRVAMENNEPKCEWREMESIPVIGPSIRTDPVLANNHFIRNVRLERESTARIDVQLEVCQYEREMESCKPEKMTDGESRRVAFLKERLDRAQAAPVNGNTINKNA